MKIIVVTPAARGSRKGNRVTADRWARLLRALGHRVRVVQRWGGEPCDVLVALHARRSADSVRRYRRERPDGALVVVLTGTDLYRDLGRSAHVTASLEMADRIVALQERARDDVPPHLRARVRVIHQSVEPPSAARPDRSVFQVCVLAHLRPVKDPFRAAMAVRRLPPTSRVVVVHAGAALSPAMERRARRETVRNPRWRWAGDLPRAAAMRLLARSRALVLSSRAEGGANVVSEAVVAGVPVIASRIPGSVGLLGEDHPGWFPVGDTAALAALLRRAETDEAFLARLRRSCVRRAPLFTPARERRAWCDLLAELSAIRGS